MSRVLWLGSLIGVALVAPIAGATSEAPPLERISCGPVPKTGHVEVSPATPHATPGLPPEIIKRVIQQNSSRFRTCYEDGLRPCPSLQGRVAIAFTILRDGSVLHPWVHSTDIPDSRVGICVARQLRGVVFPSFEGPSLRVLYPFSFAPL